MRYRLIFVSVLLLSFSCFSSFQGGAGAASETLLSLDQIESFTQNMNDLTKAIEEKRSRIKGIGKELAALKAGHKQLQLNGSAAERQRELETDLITNEESLRDLQAQLETVSKRIEQSRGYAPDLLRDQGQDDLKSAEQS